MSDVTSRAWWPKDWRKPGGQLRDKRGIMWAPTDIDDWNTGGAGNPQPDPDDAATRGVLLQLARDLHNDPRLHVTPHPVRGLWYAHDRHGRVIATGPTEFAALLAACDAAPVNTKETP